MSTELTEYREDNPPLPMAEIVEISDLPTGLPALELRVNIEGQDHRFWLGLDALEDFGVKDQVAAKALPQAVEALVGIEERLEQILNAIPNYEDLNGYIDRLAERLSQSR